jgi:hypothetical protein
MSEQALEQKPPGDTSKRPSIGTQVLAVLLMLSMVVLTFTTTRKDKAWKAWIKKIGLEQVEPVESKKK